MPTELVPRAVFVRNSLYIVRETDFLVYKSSSVETPSDETGKQVLSPILGSYWVSRLADRAMDTDGGVSVGGPRRN